MYRLQNEVSVVCDDNKNDKNNANNYYELTE